MKKPHTPPAPPPCVTNAMAQLLDVTGTPATCTLQGAGRWLIEHANDRVRTVCSYTLNSRGKWAYASTLTVDGHKRPNVNNVHSYARLFADPDLQHPDRSPVGALTPPVPLAPGELAPPLVTEIAARLSGSHAVTVGHARRTKRVSQGRTHIAYIETTLDAAPDPGMYLVQADCPNGDRIQMFLKARRPGSTAVQLDFVCAVDARGCDLMSGYGNDFDAAMQGILGFTMASFKTAPSPTQAADTRGRRNNSVEARRASVVRN